MASTTARRPLGADISLLVETWGHRVFVSDPRLLCFSHRPLASIRHPHWPTILSLGEKQVARKKGQQRSERIAELLTEGSQPAVVATDKWRIVGELYDSKASEPRLSQLRNLVCGNHSIRLLLERLWSSLGCDHQRGMSFETYFRLNALIFSVVLDDLDLTPLQGVITRSIHRDWVVDGGGAGELSFGQWSVSMLEVIDNWAPTAVAEAYVAYAEGLIPNLMGVTDSLPPREQLSWEDKSQFLKRNASRFTDQPLVKANRNARNDVVYCRIQSVHVQGPTL